MNNPEIKACPFCDMPPDVRKNPQGGELYFVSCRYNACQAKPSVSGLGELMAVTRWNRRAGDRQPATPETVGAKALASASGSVRTFNDWWRSQGRPALIAAIPEMAHADKNEWALATESARIGWAGHALDGQAPNVQAQAQPPGCATERKNDKR